MTMTRDDIVDPRLVPRWVEAGVSGVPRPAEWEYVSIVDIPELAETITAEIGFSVLPNGVVVRGKGIELGPLLERLASRIGEHVEAPLEAVAVRRGSLEWALAGRRVNLEHVDIPSGVEADEITVAVGPDGSRSVVVDGEERETFDAPLAEAIEALERDGRLRHPAFVARASNVGGGWDLTIDPL
jgi:hypothetical protein